MNRCKGYKGYLAVELQRRRRMNRRIGLGPAAFCFSLAAVLAGYWLC